MGRLPAGQTRAARRAPITPSTSGLKELYGRDALPVTLAPVLAEVPDGERQARLAMLAASRGLPVHHIESLARRGLRAGATAREAGTTTADAAPAAIPPRTLGPNRDRAMRLRAKEPARQVSFTRLVAVMDAVCCLLPVLENMGRRCGQRWQPNRPRRGSLSRSACWRVLLGPPPS